MNDTDSVSGLLQAIERTHFAPPPPPTFMEIARYPHWETAASNILAHFFDPSVGHGLGSLVMESLLCAAKIPHDDPVEVSHVRTEESTAKGNRIDIVIETNHLILGIENKIYAGLHNDLADYEHHLKSVSKKEAELLVLGLARPRDLPEDQRFVKYADFFDELMNRLDPHPPQANPLQLSFLLDFVKTIRNRTKGPRMDTDFMHLMEEHPQAVRAFLDMHKDMQGALRHELQAVANRVKGPPEWKQHFWRDDAKPRDVLVYTMALELGVSLRVEARLSHRGWVLTIDAPDGRLPARVETIQDEVLAGWQTRPWAESPSRTEVRHADSSYGPGSDPSGDLAKILTCFADKTRAYREST